MARNGPDYRSTANDFSFITYDTDVQAAPTGLRRMLEILVRSAGAQKCQFYDTPRKDKLRSCQPSSDRLVDVSASGVRTLWRRAPAFTDNPPALPLQNMKKRPAARRKDDLLRNSFRTWPAWTLFSRGLVLVSVRLECFFYVLQDTASACFSGVAIWKISDSSRALLMLGHCSSLQHCAWPPSFSSATKTLHTPGRWMLVSGRCADSRLLTS